VSDLRYTVIGSGRLTARQLKPGEVMKHLLPDLKTPSGSFMMRCPSCKAVQPWGGKLTGPDSAPTVERVLVCDCVQCQFAFRLSAGRIVVMSAKPERERRELTPEMRKAGVRYKSEQG
jgi:hypothetical protein